MDSDELSRDELKKNITEWIIKNKEINLEVTSYTDDPILLRILDLFEGKVGLEYDSTKLDQIKKDGKKRYETNIPPGYKDWKKSNGQDDNNAFGDLIFWMQILDYAKEKHVDIILVTDDRKEDWWQILHGQTLGPRPELRKEFFNETQQCFYMYSMVQFIGIAGTDADKELSDRIEDEIKPSSMPIAEIGLISLGYERGTLVALQEELDDLIELNESRFASLKGYDRLLDEGIITSKQVKQMKETMEAYNRDQKRINELKRKIRKLTVIGLGHL